MAGYWRRIERADWQRTELAVSAAVVSATETSVGGDQVGTSAAVETGTGGALVRIHVTVRTYNGGQDQQAVTRSQN